jgi:hypothetical protein
MNFKTMKRGKFRQSNISKNKALGSLPETDVIRKPASAAEADFPGNYIVADSKTEIARRIDSVNSYKAAIYKGTPHIVVKISDDEVHVFPAFIGSSETERKIREAHRLIEQENEFNH